MPFCFTAIVLAMALETVPADVLVLHAEPPADHPLTRVVPGDVWVEVEVDPNGAVLSAKAMRPGSPVVVALSEEAACGWQFSKAQEPRRAYVLTFRYRPNALTENPPYREVIHHDELSMLIQSYRSTTRWMKRQADGTLPEKFCPRHGVKMTVGMVPIRYGLARSYSSDVPADRIALRKGKRYWKAREQHFPEVNAFGGGGCTVGVEDKEERYYCEVCRQARTEWLQSHPGYEEFN